eukprot:1075575-Amphidinium_carterae.1
MRGAEPTLQQLSGISSRVHDDCPPYTDFAIFGLFGPRIARKPRFSSTQLLETYNMQKSLDQMGLRPGHGAT